MGRHAASARYEPLLTGWGGSGSNVVEEALAETRSGITRLAKISSTVCTPFKLTSLSNRTFGIS